MKAIIKRDFDVFLTALPKCLRPMSLAEVEDVIGYIHFIYFHCPVCGKLVAEEGGHSDLVCRKGSHGLAYCSSCEIEVELEVELEE